jgi:hypothetical protein
LPFPLELLLLRAGLELEEPLLLDLALLLVPLALVARDALAPDLRAEPPLLRDDELDALPLPLRDEPDDPLRLLRDELDPLEDALVLRLEDALAPCDDARPRLEARLEVPRSLATDMVHLPVWTVTRGGPSATDSAGVSLGYPSAMVATRLEGYYPRSGAA